jgi:hypothetical protein
MRISSTKTALHTTHIKMVDPGETSFTTLMLTVTHTLPTPLTSTTVYMVVAPQESTTLTYITTDTNIVTEIPTTITAM